MPLLIQKRRRKTKADPLLEVAVRYEPSLRRAAYSLLKTLQDIKDPEHADIMAAVSAAFKGAGLRPGTRSFHDAFVRVMDAGAKFAIDGLSSVRVRKHSLPLQPLPLHSLPLQPHQFIKLDVATAMAYSGNTTEAANYLRSYELQFAGGISTQARENVRQILIDAVSSGVGPKKTAQSIQDTIGLTPQQLRAVENYRRALESGQYASARQLTLRDKRFDRSMKPGVPLKPEQIDRMVQRYVERQLRYRAQMIARTETIRALNQGQIEAWRQAQQQGLIRGMREQWLPGPEACPQCDSIPPMNPWGVDIGEPFVTPYGPLAAPPAHPNCRCALGLE